MRQTFQHRVGSFLLTCEVRENLIVFDDDYLAVTEVSGEGSLLTVPEQIEWSGRKLPVRVLEKKACLGQRGLNAVELPATLERLEDWCFAQCDNLRLVKCQNPDISFGRGVFEDCRRMFAIALDGDENSAMAALLGALPYRLSAEYLLLADDIGSESWYEKWDQSLCMFLQEEDEEGYTNVVLCGEEDIQRSVEGFAEDKRKSKASLCMLRLANDEALKESARESLKAYLLAHTKGETSEEAWLALLESGDDIGAYRLFADIGAINHDNVDDMIADMGERHPEAKAFVMRYKQEHFMDGDIFESFEL